MPPTKRPMKIQLSLPRPGFRLANGGGWLDGGPAAAAISSHAGFSAVRPFSNSGSYAPLNKRGGALSEYAARHRARCDTPVMDLPPNISRTRRRPLVSDPPPPVTRRDQNVQTLDGGEACQPSSCRKAIGNLGDQGGGSLPNISQSRKTQQYVFNTLAFYVTYCTLFHGRYNISHQCVRKIKKLFYAASNFRENFGSVGTDRRPTPSPPQTICPPQLPSCPPQLLSCPPQLPSCTPQPNEDDHVVWRSGHVTELLQQIPVCRSHRILQKYGCSHTRRYYHS
jgi:hypothetical protein